jgi:hypothetical protein
MVCLSPRLHNLVIQHVPGKLHAAADMLSRPPAEDKGENDNTDLTLLPPSIFINNTYLLDSDWPELEQRIATEQQKCTHLMKDWERSQKAKIKGNLWTIQDRIIVPPDEPLKQSILQRYHDAPTKGHPGRDRTIEAVERIFWWPDLLSKDAQNANKTNREITLPVSHHSESQLPQTPYLSKRSVWISSRNCPSLEATTPS